MALFIQFHYKKIGLFGVSTNEIYQEDFLQVALLNRSTKGAKISSFRRARYS